MAFEARADERLTLGFISIMITRPFSGFKANWTLEPPVSTPIFLKHRIAQLRIFWYSLSVSVIAGATVMESPVCIPIGSIFSIEQTTIILFALSRITSSSNSFQPSKDSSTKISVIGLAIKPFFTNSLNSSMLYATDPPVPPRVNEGLIITGNSIVPINVKASFQSCTNPPFAVSIPTSFITVLKRSRSSAFSIASTWAPISWTLNFFNILSLWRSIVRFKAVCPPTVGKIASGFSFSIIAITYSNVMGSI